MNREVLNAVYGLLKVDRPVTPAGACYLLRGWDLPLVISEATEALELLVSNGYAIREPSEGFGAQYLRAKP